MGLISAWKVLVGGGAGENAPHTDFPKGTPDPHILSLAVKQQLSGIQESYLKGLVGDLELGVSSANASPSLLQDSSCKTHHCQNHSPKAQF